MVIPALFWLGTMMAMLLICYVVAGTVKFSAIFNHLAKIDNDISKPTDIEQLRKMSVG